MNKLLRADFFRLKKDLIFWFFIFFTMVFSGINIFKYCSSTGQIILDKVMNEFIMYICLFIAIFISIFVGKEYSEGIIRNKIIVGHSRITIYLSKLIITIIVSILCELIYVIIILLVGLPLFGRLQMSASQIAISMLNTFLVIIVYCSIFNFITMICSEITVSIIINILIVIIMFIIEVSVGYIANSPKYSTHSYLEDGIEYIISQEPNPNYPGDAKVNLAKTIYLFTPQGQATKIANMDIESLYQMPIYSVSLMIIINIIGLYLFSRKELK